MQISKTSKRWFWMAITLLIFFAFIPKLNSPALIIQQAFLGTRDLFIVSTIWCFLKYSLSAALVSNRFYLIMGTVSAVISIFWSYDRGIMTIAFLCIIFIGNIISKRLIDAFILILSAFFCLLILNYTHIFGDIFDNIRNIIYWVKNSKEIWHTSASADSYTLVVVAFILLFCVATIVVAFFGQFYRNKKDLFYVIGFMVIQIILVMTVMNRPGMPRLSWSTWPSILLMLHFTSRKFPLATYPPPERDEGSVTFVDPAFDAIERRYDQARHKIYSSFSINPGTRVNIFYKAYGAILLILILLLSPATPFIMYGSFLKNIIIPKLDKHIVPTEINDISCIISQSDDKCVLGWTNEGIVALMSKKRFCTQFPYSIYVSSGEELKYLQQIIMENPSVIIFDVSGASMMDIDGRSMASRLPNVYSFIQNSYKNVQQVGRYLIVTKSKL